MQMESTFLELNLMSCRDLKVFNFFQKLSVYVAVSIIGDAKDAGKKKHKQKIVMQRQKTPIHRDGDGNHEWNHTMHFDLKEISLLDPSHDVFVEFDMRSERRIYSNKTIGVVCVPLKDLIEECTGETVRFLSYQVRTTQGKPNGVLNFSCKATGDMMRRKIASGSDDRPKKDFSSSSPGSSSSSSSSSGVDMYFPTEKVKYPSLEQPEQPEQPEQLEQLEQSSSSICYPSVEQDFHFLFHRIKLSSQKLHYPTLELGYVSGIHDYTGIGQVEEGLEGVLRSVEKWE